MSPHGCRKRSAKLCHRDAEERFPVLSLNNRKPKPPHYLLIQDKAFYSLAPAQLPLYPCTTIPSLLELPVTHIFYFRAAWGMMGACVPCKTHTHRNQA